MSKRKTPRAELHIALNLEPHPLLVLHPDPLLRRRTYHVSDPTHPKVVALIRALYTKRESYKAAGLAAPQLGANAAILVYNDRRSGTRCLINPQIVSRSEDAESDWEGCLSIPVTRAKVRRSTSCEIQALNAKGDQVVVKASGWTARILQHEIDHLRGILMTDRAEMILPKKAFLEAPDSLETFEGWLDEAMARFTPERTALSDLLSISKLPTEAEVEEAIRSLSPADTHDSEAVDLETEQTNGVDEA